MQNDDEMLALARKINLDVNREIKPRSDLLNYGKQEYWTLPTNGYGDCEDYALLKMKRLIEAGIAPSRLFFATVVANSSEVHTVLVLRAPSGDYILDNLTNRMHTWRGSRYTFLKKQNANNPGRWDTVLLGPRAFRG